MEANLRVASPLSVLVLEPFLNKYLISKPARTLKRIEFTATATPLCSACYLSIPRSARTHSHGVHVITLNNFARGCASSQSRIKEFNMGL
jgi:hypothetical protein